MRMVRGAHPPQTVDSVHEREGGCNTTRYSCPPQPYPGHAGGHKLTTRGRANPPANRHGCVTPSPTRHVGRSVPTPQHKPNHPNHPSHHTRHHDVVVCFLGTRLCLFVSRKSQNTTVLFCAGSLDGAPIITQSRRHKPCSKIEVSYSAHSQLAFDASPLFTDCSAISTATCDLRAAALLLFEAITLPPR